MFGGSRVVRVEKQVGVDEDHRCPGPSACSRRHSRGISVHTVIAGALGVVVIGESSADERKSLLCKVRIAGEGLADVRLSHRDERHRVDEAQ
jgi:hypothetical protein